MSRAEAGRVCWVDEQWDRTSASDGVSRYGAYLRAEAERFEPFYGQGPGGVTLDPVEFTAGAFEVATGPIMSPGYVAWHPRVRDHQLGFGEDPEPGRLVYSVTLAAPALIRLTGLWWGWTQEFGRWVDPPTTRPAALTRLELRWLVGADQLPSRSRRRRMACPTSPTPRRRCGRSSSRSTRPPGRSWPSWRLAPAADRGGVVSGRATSH